jgi:cell division protein FtsB
MFCTYKPVYHKKLIQKTKISADIDIIMKRYCFLAAALAGTFVYVVVSLLGGRNGLWATSQLQEQKRIVGIHTAEIQKKHDRLVLEHNALLNDSDVIAAYARRLGYVNDGEKLVKINGLTPAVTEIYETGTVQKSQEPYFLPEWFCKIFGVCSGVLLLLVFLLKEYQKSLYGKKRTETKVKGVPVYDLPQM